jgi:ubiquinone/menaquinone biosynthesis C-methylase UbiE
MESKILKLILQEIKDFSQQLDSNALYYYKILEYPLVFNELNIHQNEKYLDIGPGKSIFPLFLLSKNPRQIWIVDNGSFYHDFDEFYIHCLRKLNRINYLNNRFKILKADFNEIELSKGYFDKITAISTLEHLPENKDMEAVKKIGNILKKGGKCVITLPFSQRGTYEEIIHSEFDYLQRNYEIKDIMRRIVAPSGLKLKKLLIFGEKNPKLGKIFFLKKPLSSMQWFWILHFPHKFWQIYWKWENENILKIPPKFKYAGGICIVLEK